MIYALFYCFLSPNGTIDISRPCVSVDYVFDSLAECQGMKTRYEYGNGGSPEILATKGLRYVCMSKPGAPQWRPAE